jgi:pilus assembly protein Flp/PilA
MTMVERHTGVQVINRCIARLARDQRGLTALEYGLLTGLIALAIVGAVSLFSTNANQLFTHIANTI